MDTEGKVVIITGASSGIGLASSKLYASRGYRVVMAARSVDKLAAEAASFGCNADNVLCVKTDVSIEEDCRNLIEKAVEKFGRIDILINNAFKQVPFIGLPYKHIRVGIVLCIPLKKNRNGQPVGSLIAHIRNFHRKSMLWLIALT